MDVATLSLFHLLTVQHLNEVEQNTANATGNDICCVFWWFNYTSLDNEVTLVCSRIQLLLWFTYIIKLTLNKLKTQQMKEDQHQ